MSNIASVKNIQQKRFVAGGDTILEKYKMSSAF